MHSQSIADLTRKAEERKNPLSAFDYVGEFSGELAIAKKQDEDELNAFMGVIDGEGNVHVPFVYDELSLAIKGYNYSDNIYKCRRNGKYGFVNSEGNEILPCKYSSLVNAGSVWYKATRDGKYGYVFLKGSKEPMTEVIPCVYDKLQVYPEGIIHATYKGLKGVLNIENKTLVPFEFSYISDSYNNRVWVENKGKVGIYDLQRKVLQTCDIEEAFVYVENHPCAVSYKNKPSFPDNYVYIMRNGMVGVMDSCCNTIIPCEYQHITPFVKSKAFCKKGEKWGIVKNDGKIIQPCTFSEILSDGGSVTTENTPSTAFGTYLYVKEGTKWGMLNLEGMNFIETKYDSLGYFREGMLLAKTGSMYGYINQDGQEATPFTYLQASDFSEGLAAVMTDKGKFFFINQRGDMVIKPKKYDNVGTFINGTCEVSRQGKTWRINKQGKKVKETGESVKEKEPRTKERINVRDYLRPRTSILIQQYDRRQPQQRTPMRYNQNRTSTRSQWRQNNTRTFKVKR